MRSGRPSCPRETYLSRVCPLSSASTRSARRGGGRCLPGAGATALGQRRRNASRTSAEEAPPWARRHAHALSVRAPLSGEVELQFSRAGAGRSALREKAQAWGEHGAQARFTCCAGRCPNGGAAPLGSDRAWRRGARPGDHPGLGSETHLWATEMAASGAGPPFSCFSCN